MENHERIDFYFIRSKNNFLRDLPVIQFHYRTKWKRQTAVGLELLAEAGNYAAFQRLYGGPPYIGSWPYPQVPSANPTSTVDLYYRQAAAAAALQKPLPYRLYPGATGLSPLVPGPSAPQFAHHPLVNSLSTLSNYCSTSSNNSHERSPSPTLNPGSPEGRSERSNSQSDNEDTLQV